MVEYAFDKQLNKEVTAIEASVHFDNPNNREYILYPPSIKNFNEVWEKNNKQEIKCSFRRGSLKKNKYGTEFQVVPHFIIPSSNDLGVLFHENESEEHKMLKNFIYNYFQRKKVTLSYSKYDTNTEKNIHNTIVLDPKDYLYGSEEVRVSTGKNIKYADVFLKFKEKHKILGEGLIIEIQLSSQKDNKTKERTIDRALTGNSTIWLYPEDFEIEKESGVIILLKEILEVKPYLVTLREYEDKFFQRSDEKVFQLKKFIENKNNFIEEKIINKLQLVESEWNSNIESKKKESFNDVEEIKNTLNMIIDSKKGQVEEIKNTLNMIIDSKKEEVENYKYNLNKKIDEYKFQYEEIKNNFESLRDYDADLSLKTQNRKKQLDEIDTKIENTKQKESNLNYIKEIIREVDSFKMEQYNSLIKEINSLDIKKEEIESLKKSISEIKETNIEDYKFIDEFNQKLKKYDNMYKEYNQNIINLNDSIDARINHKINVKGGNKE